MAPETWSELLEQSRLHEFVASSGDRAGFRRWLAAHPPAAGSRFATALLERVSGPDTRSARQQPRFFYKGIRSKPWFDPAAADFANWTRIIEDGYEDIKQELMALDLGGESAGFQVQPETFVPRSGRWDFFYFSYWGRELEENCRRCPKTYELIKRVAPAKNAPGAIGFSALGAGSRVLPHSDPINLRVRCHLGLVVPTGDCRIRVGDETRAWEQGKCMVFDDSFDHQTWNNTQHTRVVFGIDFWHPALSQSEREFLEATYSHPESPLSAQLHRHSAEIAEAL